MTVTYSLEDWIKNSQSGSNIWHFLTDSFLQQTFTQPDDFFLQLNINAISHLVILDLCMMNKQ